MTDYKISPLHSPEAEEPLQTILKQGARQLLQQAIEAELEEHLGKLRFFANP